MNITDSFIVTLEDAKDYCGIALFMVSLIKQKGSVSLEEIMEWTGASRQGIYKAARDNGINYKRGKFFF